MNMLCCGADDYKMEQKKKKSLPNISNNWPHMYQITICTPSLVSCADSFNYIRTFIFFSILKIYTLVHIMNKSFLHAYMYNKMLVLKCMAYAFIFFSLLQE